MDYHRHPRFYRHEPLHQSGSGKIRLQQRRIGFLAHEFCSRHACRHSENAGRHICHAALENPPQPQRHRHSGDVVPVLCRYPPAAGNRRNLKLHLVDFLAVFSFLILKERIAFYTQAILVFGFIGVVLLLNPSFKSGQEIAALAGLAGGAMSGWAYLQVRELSLLGEPGWRVVFYLSVTGVAMSSVWATLTGWHSLSAEALPYLAGIGLSATIAQLCMTRAYKVGNKFTVASLSYLTVVFSALSGVMFLGDSVTWQETAPDDRRGRPVLRDRKSVV